MELSFEIEVGSKKWHGEIDRSKKMVFYPESPFLKIKGLGDFL